MARRRPPLWRRLKALLLLLQPAPATTVLHAPLLSPSLPAPSPGRCPWTNPAALSLLQADVHVRCAATRRPQRGWPAGCARHYMRAAAMATMLHGFPRAKNSLRVDRHARHTASSSRPACMRNQLSLIFNPHTITYCSTNPHWRVLHCTLNAQSRLRCCMRHRASCLRNAPGGTPRISGPLPEGVGPWPGRTEDGSEQQVHSTSCLSRFDCRGGMSGQGAAVNRTRLPPATPSTTLRRRASSCTRWGSPVRPTGGRTTHADGMCMRT